MLGQVSELLEVRELKTQPGILTLLGAHWVPARVDLEGHAVPWPTGSAPTPIMLTT